MQELLFRQEEGQRAAVVRHGVVGLRAYQKDLRSAAARRRPNLPGAGFLHADRGTQWRSTVRALSFDRVMESVQNTSHRILIVEDEAEVCALLEDFLSEEGYEVSCAANDDAAYAELRRDWQSIDALVVDINLGRGTTG